MERRKYYYKIYGLNIESEIEMPELMRGNNREYIDVEVVRGELPEFIQEQKKAGRHDYIRFPYVHWFYKQKAGDFYIEDGKKITINIEEGSSETMLHAMLLGWGMGIILEQRECVAIHGGAIVYNEKAFIISGDSGAGKTTTVQELLKQKVGFLADDTVAIQIREGGQAMAEPGYPLQKLCRDVVARMNINITEMILLDEEREKYGILRWKEFEHNEREIGGIFILRPYEGEEVELKQIEGAEKLKMLLDNLYTSLVYRIIGISPGLMKECIQLAKFTPIYIVRRPRNMQTADKVAKCITEVMKTKNENIYS